MSYLKAFTTQMTNFMNELHEMFPNDRSISIANDSLYLIVKTNPRKLLDFFKEYFLPHEHNILTMNEDFFLKRNYDDEISDYVKSFNAITNLKNYWSKMSLESKKNIWLYLKVLIKLSKKA